MFVGKEATSAHVGSGWVFGTEADEKRSDESVVGVWLEVLLLSM